MGIQQFKQPKKGSRSDGVYDDPGFLADLPSADPLSQQKSRDAQNSIDNIDNVLAGNDLARREQGGGSLYNSGGEGGSGGGNGPDGDSGPGDGKDTLKNREESAGGGAAAGAGGAAMKTLGGPVGNMVNLIQKVAASKNGKRAGIAGLAGTGIVAIIIAGIMAILPLKVLSVMNNLREDFFSMSDDAANRMSDRLLGQYIIQKVIPGMVDGACTTTRRDRSCAAINPSNNPVTTLFVTWKDANLEGKLANNHGVEIRKVGTKFYLRAPGLNGDLDLGTYNASTRTLSGQPYAKLNRTEVRRIVRASFQDETFSKRVRMKYSVGLLLERKYGIRRCILACDIRDKLSDNVDHRKNAFRLFMTERIVMPYSETMGLAIGCAMSEFDCAEPGDANEDGEKLSRFQIEVRTTLAQYRTAHGTHSLEQLDTEAEKVKQHGMTGYIVRRLAGELVGDLIAKLGGKVIPFLGWIDGAAAIYETGKNAGPALKHINYAMRMSSLAIPMAAMMFTVADEAKTGHVDTTAMGGMSAGLGQNPANDQGGGAMEDTPLHDAMNSGTTGQTQTASALELLAPKAHAADEVTAYTCDAGDLVPFGETTCPEVGFGLLSTTGQMAANIGDVLNSGIFAPANIALSIWNATVGAIYDAVVGFFGNLLGSTIAALTPDQIEALVAWIGKNIMNQFFVDPLGLNPSGGRVFELAALGVNGMANEDAQWNQGGRVLTAAEEKEIRLAVAEENMEAFAAKPFYARLFDTEDTHSLVSRVALTMPSTSDGLISNMASYLHNPIRSLSVGVSTLLAPPKAEAAFVLPKSPFGLPTYGYPRNHPIFQEGNDLEKYWDDNECSRTDMKKEWGQKATLEPTRPEFKEFAENTQVPVQLENEPCMLIRSEVAAAGSQYNTELLLEPPALPMIPGAQTPPPAGTGGTAIQTGTTQQLAQKIDVHPNISFQTGAGEANFKEIVATGKAETCGAPTISPMLLGVILKLAEEYKIVLGVFVDGHSCNNGYHPQGMAVDINGVNPLDPAAGPRGTGTRIGDGPATGFDPEEQEIMTAFYRRAGEILGANGGGGLGQVQCFTGAVPKVSTPPNVYFVDPCNHLHMDTRGK